MPVAAIIAIVIVSIILLLALLLSIRVRLQVLGKNTDLTVALRILCYKYTFFPEEKSVRSVAKDEKKERKKARKKAKKTADIQADESTPPPKKKKRSILNIIRLITYMLKRLYKRFPNYFQLRLKKVIIVVGGEDAAKTAIYYGTVRASVAYLLTMCESLFTMKTPRNAKLLIEPNYLTNESMCDIDLDLSISLFAALRLLIRAYPIYQDGKKAIKTKKKKQKNKVGDNLPVQPQT